MSNIISGELLFSNRIPMSRMRYDGTKGLFVHDFLILSKPIHRAVDHHGVFQVRMLKVKLHSVDSFLQCYKIVIFKRKKFK